MVMFCKSDSSPIFFSLTMKFEKLSLFSWDAEKKSIRLLNSGYWIRNSLFIMAIQPSSPNIGVFSSNLEDILSKRSETDCILLYFLFPFFLPRFSSIIQLHFVTLSLSKTIMCHHHLVFTCLWG